MWQREQYSPDIFVCVPMFHQPELSCVKLYSAPYFFILFLPLLLDMGEPSTTALHPPPKPSNTDGKIYNHISISN